MDILGIANSSYVSNPLYRFDCDAGSTSIEQTNVEPEYKESTESYSSEDSFGSSQNDKWNEKWIEIKSLHTEQKYKDFSHLAQDFEVKKTDLHHFFPISDLLVLSTIVFQNYYFRIISSRLREDYFT